MWASSKLLFLANLTILIPSILLFLLFQSTAAAAAAVGQPVLTTSGTVQGHAAPDYPEVSEYLGIPFGQNTAGSARWLPPTRFNGTGIINGTNFGFACPQSISIGTVDTSEDCLTINVWNKGSSNTTTTTTTAKAVMLWIYGGAFVTGDSSSSQFYGATLANTQDVVVVVFNYRVGIFGFPGAPGLEQQNPGFWDQRLAIEWTRDNIAAFGGDPARITLFGESAGAYSVDIYSFAWAEDPIVNALLSESGSAMRTGGPLVGLAHQLDGYAKWYNVSQQLGCGGPEMAATTLDCMRQKTADEVLSAAGEVATGGILQPDFNPWIDEKTVFTDIRERALNGNFIKKPLLTGSNYNESVLFREIGPLMGEILSEEQVAALDIEFRCGARDSALARLQTQIPVWRYIFANQNTLLNMGATHGDEVAEVFGDGTGLSSVFQPAWAAFAQDPVNGLKNLGWPTYTADGPNLALIAPAEQISVEFVAPGIYDSACPAPLLAK